MKLSHIGIGIVAWFAVSEIYTNMKKIEIREYVESLPGSILDVGATGTGNIFSITSIIDRATKCDIEPTGDMDYCDLSVKLPYADNEFDIVYVTHVLEHIPPETVENAINELNRIGRKVIILLPHPLTLMYIFVPGHLSLISITQNGISVRNNPLQINKHFQKNIELLPKFEVYN